MWNGRKTMRNLQYGMTERAELQRRRFVWFVWFIGSLWLTASDNQTDETIQMNQTDRMLAACSISPLRLNDEMAPPVLLITGFGAVLTKRALFAVRHDDEALGPDPEICQIITDRLGPLLRQHEVVGRAAPLIAMPFYFQQNGRMLAQPLGIPGERLSPFLIDGPAVVAEKDITQAGRRRRVLFCPHFVHLPSCGGRVHLGHGNAGTQPFRAVGIGHGRAGCAVGQSRLGVGGIAV